jgi:hypothetical protein
MSKYADKQRRLAEDASYGTLYEEQPSRNSIDVENKTNAIRKHQSKIDILTDKIRGAELQVKAYQMLIDGTPESHTQVRARYAKYMQGQIYSIECNRKAIENHREKMKKIRDEIKL